MSPLLDRPISRLQSEFDPFALRSRTGRIGVAAVEPNDTCRHISIARRRNLELKNLAATNSTLDHNRQTASTLSEKTAELESVKSKLEEYKRLADTDPLTQICNRRAFDKEIARIYNSNQGILFNALILADIDRFKEINDRYGHPVGDKIIQIVADILQSSIRADMFVARTGGEEFALIVEGASEDTTCDIAERIRALIEQTPFTSSQTGTNYGTVTVSLGICMASEADGPEDLYTKADRALYRSKVSGRNRVTRHSTMAGRTGKGWLLYKKD